jgi:sugar/nucleoside kinase (ribokinase family)
VSAVTDLLCIGDVMLDVHARSAALAHGGDVHGRVAVRPGGTSANAAVWATWAGASAAVIAAVGEDLVGDLLTGSLEARGVDIVPLVRRPVRSGVMLVVVVEGDRSMVADRGANERLEAGDLPARLTAQAVLVSGYLLLQEPGHDVALAALERADAGIVAVEAASWPLVARHGAARFLDETSTAGLVLANDDEARVLTDRTGAAAAAALGERHRFAAVKHGAAGATLSADGVLHTAAAEPIEEVDPTGAGDAFDGVLLAGLVRGDDPAAALAAACHAGALVAAGPDNWPVGSP